MTLFNGSRSICVPVLIAFTLLCTEFTIAAERPNIILVMCDDLGWQDVGFNGSDIVKTPHLDEMSSNSLRFTRFYAQSPVCSPTRGSCLTGRHPYRYGIPFANAGHMKAEELTLAELLKRQGYNTGHFGKWHLGILSTDVVEGNRGGKASNKKHYSPPQDNGFDVCFATEAKVPTFDPMWTPKGNKKKLNEWDAIVDKSQAEPYGTHYWNQDGEIVRENLDGDDSRVIMDRAVPFIERSASEGKPFFAVVWFHTPHLPVVADKAHRDMYSQFETIRAQNYYGCITAMDEQIGRLRKTLRDAGVAENTVVTFCSDNGPEGNNSAPGSAGPYRGRKRSLYEGGIRVPGLIEWPARIKPGTSTSFPAVTSDYLPTIIDLMDIEMQDSRPLDGISLLPVMNGEQMERSKPIGFQSKEQVALSDNQYKLYRTDQKAWELYDLLNDPSESTNIASMHPEKVEQMSEELLTWQASCKASDSGADY